MLSEHFLPGRALSNQQGWLEDLQFLHERKFPIPKFAWNAVRNQAVDLLEKEYCWHGKKEIKFHNNVFGSFDEMVERYKCMPESEINYAGARTNKEKFDEIMNIYLKKGIIRFSKTVRGQ